MSSLLGLAAKVGCTLALSSLCSAGFYWGFSLLGNLKTFYDSALIDFLNGGGNIRFFVDAESFQEETTIKFPRGKDSMIASIEISSGDLEADEDYLESLRKLNGGGK